MKKDEDCNSEYFELNNKQISELIKLAKFKKNDVFYDLGAGTGKVVMAVAKSSPVVKSIGIENTKCIYEKARKQLNNQYRNGKIKNLDRVDFWLGSITNEEVDNDDILTLDYSDATIVFAGNAEDFGDIKLYKERIKHKKLRLISKDIPLVGYESKANRSNNDCWFFLSKRPFKRISKKMWIKSVCPSFKSLNDIYDYYYNRLERRFRENPEKPDKISKKLARSAILELQLLINERF